MIKRLDYKCFDSYNEELSKRNQAYRSPEAIDAFESYV
jgi:hypothetical protein